MEQRGISSKRAEDRKDGAAVVTVFEQAAKRFLALTAVPAYLFLLASLFSEATDSSLAVTLALTLLAALVIMVVITLLSEKVYEYRRTGIRFSLSTAFLVSIPLCIYLAAIQQVLKRSPMDDDPVVWIVGTVVSVWWMVITSVALLWFAEAVVTLAVGFRRSWMAPGSTSKHLPPRTSANKRQGPTNELPEQGRSRTIMIHDYRSAWPEEYEQIRFGLQQILGSLALQVDHIGSTSVPGLAAKDVIDVQVTVRELTAEVMDRLTLAGYEHCATLTHDHVPTGEADDPNLWEKRVFTQPLGQRRANIHLRVAGRPNHRYALLFRDYLRAHPNLIQVVSVIKREIAKRHPADVASYYAIKDPVYDLLCEAAQEWSIRSGWNP